MRSINENLFGENIFAYLFKCKMLIIIFKHVALYVTFAFLNLNSKYFLIQNGNYASTLFYIIFKQSQNLSLTLKF